MSQPTLASLLIKKKKKSPSKYKKTKNRVFTWWGFIFLHIASWILWLILTISNVNTQWNNLIFTAPIIFFNILMIILTRRNFNNNINLENALTALDSKSATANQITMIGKKNFKNVEESLMLRNGSVRAFLILCLISLMIAYIYESQPLPIPLLVAFSIILVYYEIKPEDVLPKNFIVSVPENYGTIKRMPVVSTIINKGKGELTSLQKKLNEINKLANSNLNAAQNEFSRIQEIYEKRFNNLVDKTDNLVITSKNKWEQIGIIGLLGFVAFAGLYFIEQVNDPLNAITITLASLLSIVSIVFGINIQEIMLDTVKTQVDNVFFEIEKVLIETKELLNKGYSKINDIINSIIEGLTKIEKKNLLTFFPKDIVACITVNLMTFFSVLIILLPTYLSNQWILIGIEFIIGYYFMTKK